MKKKVFSKLLMVALVATVGVFSSCKDYDDDIADVRNNLSQTATELRTDYTNKISLVQNSITELTKSLANLEDAYQKADAKLKSDLTIDINNAVATAKAYSDANLGKALDAATAAQEAAKIYTDQQRVAAEAAALGAATKLVNEAKAELTESLAAAEKLIATQGESIANLIKADERLTNAVSAAQSKADQAYALAEKANTLAEQNKAAVEKAAADIVTLQTDLANLKGTAANASDVSKLQEQLAALQKQVNENVVNLADYNTNLTQTTSDLAKLKENLDKEVSILGESIAAVQKTANDNVASITAINEQIIKLQEYDKAIDAKIVESVNTLNALIEKNQGDNASALKQAVEGIEAKLGALQTLIETNQTAIETLLNTKVSELNKLIEGNASEIGKNASAIAKNAEAQAAENVLMQNNIAQNAKDIVAQGKDITKLDDAIKAIKKALGDDTAETLKAYAKSIAESNALQAKLDAQGYADAQDAAQKLTLMQAIKDQADQDAKAWTAAINLAIENLVTTYKLASLNEYIKTTAEAAQTAAEKNAAVKAQEIANKALADAKAYTDILAQTLKDNYTTSTDMQAAIETAKKAAISQAYLDVLNTLLRDYDEWYNMNDENKMNLELTPTIIELTKAAVEKYGLTKENAQSIIDATIEAGLTKPEGTGTYDKDGNEIMTEPGVIMAEILAAADALQADFNQKFNDMDLRVADIEKILGVTLNADGDSILAGNIFKASVNALIATATNQKFADLNEQLAGTKASGLLTQIEAAAAQANQNAIDLKAIDAAIANLNTKFTGLTPASDEVKSNLTEDNFTAFGANIDKLIARVNKNSELVDAFNEKVMAVVNTFLKDNVSSMITSINLYANQHQHNSDSYNAWNGFNHSLVFTYAIEKGTEFPWADMQKYVDGKLTFNKGYVHTLTDSILVRVNPVNAELDPAKIALINSKGEDVIAKGIVKVVSAVRLDRPFYLTRAESSEVKHTGLWVITFKLVEESPTVWQDFKEAAFAPIDASLAQPAGQQVLSGNKILYSVGVKNTDFSGAADPTDDGIDRYVVSEYDLDLGTQKSYHVWDYNVNNETVAKIHNRYIVNENKPNAASAAKLWTADKEAFPDTYYEELTYAPMDSVDFFTYSGSNNYPYDYDCAMTDTAKRTGPIANNAYYYIGNNVTKNGQQVFDEFGNAVVFDHPAYTYEELVADKAYKFGKLKTNADVTKFNVIDRYHFAIDQNYAATGSNADRRYSGGYMTNGVDNRHDFPIKTIQFDTDGWANIDIEFPNYICDESRGMVAKVAGFFVMLDQNFARESNTSEIGAWTQYIYDGVGFQSMNGYDPRTGEFELDNDREDTQAGIKDGIRKATLFEGNKGTIRIKNKRGAKGDVIGFRVYAVNLDGTLYDPDGRAFYVKVGDDSESHTLNFKVNVFNEYNDTAYNEKDLTYGDKKGLDINGWNTESLKADGNEFFNIPQKELTKGTQYRFNWTWTETDEAGNKYDDIAPVYDASYATLYTPKDGETSNISNLFQFSYFGESDADKLPNAVRYTGYGTQYTISKSNSNFNVPVNTVQVKLLYANRLVDGATYHLKLTITKIDTDGAESVANVIYVNVEKIMPNRPPKAFMLRDVQDKVVTFYMRPKHTTNSWSISSWFTTVKATLEKYGDKALYGAAQIGDLDYAGGINYFHEYRWATDVRPYNFEEIFHGLIVKPVAGATPSNSTTSDYIKQFDQNYMFYFPGCGKYTESNVKDEVAEAVADTAITYFRNDARMYPYQMTYTGLNSDKNQQTTLYPGYYLPYIYYGNVAENGKGKEVPVMVSYIYRNISLTLTKNASGQITGYTRGDFTTKPTYFKANGDACEKAQSEFKVKFECAIDPTFAITSMQDSVKAYNADGRTVAAGINGKLVSGETDIDKALAKAINYGNKFEVAFDSLTVSWTSNKAAYQAVANTGASYFRTNFAQFAQKFDAVDKATAYYMDTLWIWSQNNAANILVDKNGAQANHIRIVDADQQPKIEDVKLTIFKSASDVTGQAATVDHYFEVSQFDGTATNGKFNKYGLIFIPKATSLDPTKIHRMKIVVKSSTPSLVHQWGHMKVGEPTSREIWIKNPASTPHIGTARQAR